jgi:hypothetical protein
MSSGSRGCVRPASSSRIASAAISESMSPERANRSSHRRSDSSSASSHAPTASCSASGSFDASATAFCSSRPTKRDFSSVERDTCCLSVGRHSRALVNCARGRRTDESPACARPLRYALMIAGVALRPRARQRHLPPWRRRAPILTYLLILGYSYQYATQTRSTRCDVCAIESVASEATSDVLRERRYAPLTSSRKRNLGAPRLQSGRWRWRALGRSAT